MNFEVSSGNYAFNKIYIIASGIIKRDNEYIGVVASIENYNIKE